MSNHRFKQKANYNTNREDHRDERERDALNYTLIGHRILYSCKQLTLAPKNIKRGNRKRKKKVLSAKGGSILMPHFICMNTHIGDIYIYIYIYI